MAINNMSANLTGPVYALNVHYWEQILLAIPIGIIAITGLIGNSMIITAVAFSKKLQTSTNAFVTNLSVADLLTSFILLWYAVGNLGRREWPIPGADWICQATGFMIYASIATSMWNLGTIALNRLIYITRPFWYKKIFKTWNLVILIAMTWVIPTAGLLTPLATGDVTFGYNRERLVCSTAVDTDVFTYAQVAAGLLLPLPAIFVSYLLIYIRVKKRSKVQRQHLSNLPQMLVTMEASNSSREMIIMESTTSATDDVTTETDTKKPVSRKKQISRQEIQITKNLFMVVVAFFACFLPYFVAQPIRSRVNIEHIYFYIKIIPLFNSAINFMIYASKHPDFKVVLRHMMRCSYADIPQPSPLLKYLLSIRN